MKSMRAHLAKQFSEKVYPNPATPKVAKKLAAGIAEFKEKYLGKSFPWVVKGREITTFGFDETRDPNSPLIVVGKFPHFLGNDLERVIRDEVPAIRAAGRKFFLATPWQKRVKLLRMIS